MLLLRRILSFVENTPLSLASGSAALTAIILARLTIENSLWSFETRPVSFLFFEFTHTFLFFLCAFLLLLPIVRYAGTTDCKTAANILLFGFLIILFPPVVDKLIFGTHPFWSFYEFDGLTGLMKRFVTFFGDTPDVGITYGVRAEVALATIVLGMYTYLKSKQLRKAFGVMLLAYALLFVLGTLPSWLSLLFLGFEKNLWSIGAADIAALFLTPESIFTRPIDDLRNVLNVKMSLVLGVMALIAAEVVLYRYRPAHFWALFKNARFPQIFYHSDLLLLGMGLALLYAPAAFTFDIFHCFALLSLLAAVACAWIASVVVNDIFDVRIDERTNPNRPLVLGTIPPETYRAYGFIFFLFSLLLSGLVSFSAMFLLFGYQAIAWLYSAPPLRLKRIPVVATLLAGLAGMLVLFAGYVVIASDQSIRTLPLALSAFLFLAYTLSLPLKDFKDIEGDRADGIFTLPVLLGETRAKLLLGGLTFLLFIASPFVFGERALFLPSLVGGGLAFWLIQKSHSDASSIFSYRKLPCNMLIVVTLYTLWLACLLWY